jgi:hypothetical protein
VVAFTRLVAARHGGFSRIHRRPPTPCAYRLGGPDRTDELLAPYCRAVGSRTAGSDPPPSRDGSPHDLPFRGRRGRQPATAPDPSIAAVGLRRRHPDESGRLPSASPRVLRPEWDRPRSLFTRVVSPRTLSLASSHPPSRAEAPLDGAACLVKGWRVASSYPFAPRGSPRRCRHVVPRDASGKMRLTDFCNRLASRAPAVWPIPGRTRVKPVLRRVWTRCSSPRAETRERSSRDRFGTLPLPPRRMSQPGGASLDGDSPASCDLA